MIKPTWLLVHVLVLTLLLVGGRAAAALPAQQGANGGCASGSVYDPDCDVNRDGATDVVDLSLVASHWAQEGEWRSDAWLLAGNADTNPATHFLGTTDAQPLVIRTNGAEAMRVDASGKVGIGGSTPTELLTVRGNILIPTANNQFMGGNGGLGFPSNLGDNSGGALLTNVGSIDIVFDSDNNDNSRSFRIMGNGANRNSATPFLSINESGNVGIATTSQNMTDKLTVAGTANFAQDVDLRGHVGIGTSAGADTLHVRETSSSGSATIRMSAGGSWPLIFTQTSASQFSIENGGVQRLAMTSQGIEINNNAEDPVVRFRNDTGNIEGYDATGDRNFELRHQFNTTNTGAWMSLNDNGSERITLAARNGDTNRGGLIDVKNNAGVPTVRIIGDTGSGSGRLQSSVVEITGGSDVAEPFDVAGDRVKPGFVVVIDPARPGKLAIAYQAYDRKVAGVISGAGGINAGMLMGQRESVADGNHPVALVGRAYVRADASFGAIQPGDLLTTSATPGHAMKVSDHARAQGAILGKAMTALESGRGLVLVLISLQ